MLLAQPHFLTFTLRSFGKKSLRPKQAAFEMALSVTSVIVVIIDNSPRQISGDLLEFEYLIKLRNQNAP